MDKASEQHLLQMMERLFAEMEAKTEARQEKANAEMKARLEKANADAKARHEEAVAHQEKSKATILASFRGSTTCQSGTTSSSEEMGATNLEAMPEETEAAVERQELREKEINFENIGSSEDRCEEQRLVVRRRRWAKKWTQDSVGFRQKSSATRKRVIRRAVPAVRKGHMRKGAGKNNVARGASRGKMLDKRQRNNSKCEDGRLGRDLKKRLHLWMWRTSRRNFKKPIQLEKKKRIFGSMNGLHKANKWTFWKVRPPPKCKKEVQTD
jgi:hypothetical protein